MTEKQMNKHEKKKNRQKARKADDKTDRQQNRQIDRETKKQKTGRTTIMHEQSDRRTNLVCDNLKKKILSKTDRETKPTDRHTHDRSEK